MNKIILASNNKNKLKELTALFADSQLSIVTQNELNINSVAETGATFVENALLKARHASAIAKLPAIGDDSGLCVAALNGKPGILSSRYAGANSNDEENNYKLLTEMQNISNRKAYFICVLVFLRFAKDPMPIIAQGILCGEITTAAIGEYGFGYDPLFYLPEKGKTTAQLLPAEKNNCSHRAQAMNILKQQLYKLN